MKTILAFDLSSARTGCVCASLDDKEIKFMDTFSVSPSVNRHGIISGLGFLPQKQTLSKKGKKMSFYAKSHGEQITQAEKQKRDVLVRNTVNGIIKKEISSAFKKVVENIKPDLILVERNEAFNGVLTTKFLAEIRGILEGVAVEQPILQYSVSEIRKKFNLAKMTREYIKSLDNPKYIQGKKDITKLVIKDYLENKYSIRCGNTDESDALAVFDHYYETEVKSND